jgi:hypothetical protein
VVSSSTTSTVPIFLLRCVCTRKHEASWQSDRESVPYPYLEMPFDHWVPRAHLLSNEQSRASIVADAGTVLGQSPPAQPRRPSITIRTTTKLTVRRPLHFITPMHAHASSGTPTELSHRVPSKYLWKRDQNFTLVMNSRRDPDFRRQGRSAYRMGRRLYSSRISCYQCVRVWYHDPSAVDESGNAITHAAVPHSEAKL